MERSRDGDLAMIELDVPVPAGTDPAHIEAIVAGLCASAGLRRTLSSTLATYPGSVHWHYVHGRERGTLELTWWPARERLWLKVSAARTAPWIAALLPALRQQLMQDLLMDARPSARPQPAAHRER